MGRRWLGTNGSTELSTNQMAVLNFSRQDWLYKALLKGEGRITQTFAPVTKHVSILVFY